MKRGAIDLKRLALVRCLNPRSFQQQAAILPAAQNMRHILMRFETIPLDQPDALNAMRQKEIRGREVRCEAYRPVVELIRFDVQSIAVALGIEQKHWRRVVREVRPRQPAAPNRKALMVGNTSTAATERREIGSKMVGGFKS